MKKIEDYNRIFARFEELANTENDIINQRVKLLIKNMIDNRKSGWEKTKKASEAGPKKIEDLRKELEQKAREEEMLRL